MSSPYIGVTGATTKRQVDELIRGMFQTFSLWPSDRKLAVGLLTIERCLGIKSVEGRNVPLELMPEIWSTDPRCLNILHFCSHSQGDKLLAELDQLLPVLARDICHGVQLNTPDLDPRVLRRFRDNLGTEKLITLQFGGRASQDWSVEDSLRLLDQYGEIVSLYDYLLFDFSAGRGLDLDPKILQLLIDQAADWPVRLVVAGGLNHLNLSTRLRRLVDAYPHLSWDAESKLMDCGQFSSYLAIAYLKESVFLLLASWVKLG